MLGHEQRLDIVLRIGDCDRSIFWYTAYLMLRRLNEAVEASASEQEQAAHSMADRWRIRHSQGRLQSGGRELGASICRPKTSFSAISASITSSRHVASAT